MKTRLAAAAALLSVVSVFGGDALAVPTFQDRSEIDARYKWTLEDIYVDDAAWEADLVRLREMLPEVEAYRGRLGESGAVLLGALETADAVRSLFEQLQVYASMRYDQDTRSDTYAGMRDRIESVGTQVSERLSFIPPEIMAVPEADLWAMVDATPGLPIYRHFLEAMLRDRDHVLDAEGETIMALAGDVTGSFLNVFGSFHNADVTYGTLLDEDGKEVKLTKGLYRVFQESPDRRVRRESWHLFYRAYDAFGRTLASNMSGNVKSHVFNARARHYDSALEAATEPNAIPPEVYRNLIRTVRENLGPLHRYVALRKELLGVDTLQVWDMAAPLVEPTRTDIPWDEAVQLVEDGLSVLGPEYMEPFKKGLASGWVDVYETPGKRSGAYSWGSYTTKPYLLLNYRGTLDNAFTLAHEMGHSMHSYFTRANQPHVYGDYSTFVAEVASTTNEALLIEKMLERSTDPKERLFLLNHYLEQIRGTFFTQVLFADIELQMHEAVERGEPLTKESLDAIYNDTYAVYFGPALHIDPLNGAAWSRIPHFYYNFYMYQYATSYAAATALAHSILEEGDPAVGRLLTFLKSGSSDYPIEVLKRAGVDMTTPQPILDTIAVFDRLLDRTEA